MGFQHLQWALSYRGTPLRPTERALLIYLCDFMRDDDPELGCWPNTETLGEALEITARNVRILLAKLEEKGVIRREIHRRRPTIIRIPAFMEDTAFRQQAETTPEQRMQSSANSELADAPFRKPPSSNESLRNSPSEWRKNPVALAESCIPPSIYEPSREPSTPPPSDASSPSVAGPTPTTVDPGGGGGDEFSIEESFEESRQRLVEWWAAHVVPIDDRVLPTPEVTNEQIRMFRDRLREIPDLEQRVVEGLDPLAPWVSVTITIEQLLKSKTALQKAIGGLYRDKDPAKREARAQARRLQERLRRKAQILHSDPSTYLTGEVIQVEDIPA